MKKNLFPITMALGFALTLIACGDSGTNSGSEDETGSGDKNSFENSGTKDGVVKMSSMVDPRDGTTYKIARVGTQVWMAENINFETSESYCYDNDVKNCEKFGRLYTRKAAQEACPKGWILPKIYDFQRLVDYSGVYSGRVQNATKRLMVKEFCDKYGCGTEEFGFS